MSKQLPKLGTPEFDFHMEDQSREAMDNAAATFATRLFFGLLFVVSLFAVFILNDYWITGDRPLWEKVLLCATCPLYFGPALLYMGSIAFAGKSGLQWWRSWVQQRQTPEES